MYRLLGRLKRCCWFTWVVFILVSLAVTLIAVPGDPATAYQSFDGVDRSGWSESLETAIKDQYSPGDLGLNEQIKIDQYRHGWPLPCMTRGIGRVVLRKNRPGVVGGKGTDVRGHPRTQPLLSIDLPSDGDSYTLVPMANSKSYKMVPDDWEKTPLYWSDYNRWPLATDGAEWRIDYLLTNLAVLFTIPITAALMTERWVRRRGDVLRFRLVDLMVAFVLCSLAFGWFRSHADLREFEQSIESQGSPFIHVNDSLCEQWQIRELGRSNFHGYDRRYFGPDWLRRLIGNRELLRFSKHIIAVQLVPDELWQANLELLPELEYLESVSLPNGVTQQAIDRLEKVQRLRKVQIGFASDESQQRLGESAINTTDRWVNAQDLALLRRLSIEELGLMGEDLLVEDIEQVISMPDLKRLELIEASITLSELERLKKEYPNVEVTCYWGYETISRFSYGRSLMFRDTPPSNLNHRIESVRHQRLEAIAED